MQCYWQLTSQGVMLAGSGVNAQWAVTDYVLTHVWVQISAEQLVDIGVKWVILGHSERRSLLKESNDFVGEKVAYALSHGLRVIACIGETLEQRESGQV